MGNGEDYEIESCSFTSDISFANKQMIRYLRELGYYLKWVLKSKYRWFLILFTLWLYRVEFMPDTGIGMAKILQVGTIFGILVLLLKRQPNLFQRMMRRTNATKVKENQN